MEPIQQLLESRKELKMHSIKKLCNKKYIWLSLVIAFSMIISVTMCVMKSGYYIDEYYTYTLANGTHLGIDIRNGEWNDNKAFFDEIAISEDSRFSFAQAAKNTADDVHPPLYYFVVNFISSFFPEMYSKWFAWAVNLISLLICELLVFEIIMILSNDNTFASIVCTLCYAMNPAVISNIVYFRMYFMLSAIISGYLLIHLKMLKDHNITNFRLGLLMVVGTIGFLTHYHMLFAMVIIGGLFVGYCLLFRKETLKILLYCIAVGMIVVLEYVLWPIFIAHIFIGYRGKGAIDSMANIGGYISKLRFMWECLNGNLYGYLLPMVLLILIVLLITRLCSSKMLSDMKKDSSGIISIVEQNRYYIFILLACLGYIIVASITGLDSNRFLFPMEGILVATISYLIFAGVYDLIWRKNTTVNIRLLISSAVCICISVVVIISAIYHGKIEYLFLDRRIVNEAVYSNENDRIVVFHDIWYDRLIDYYPEFDKTYFCGKDVPINKACEDLSEYLQEHKNVLVFVEDSREQADVYNVLKESYKSDVSMVLIGDANEFFKVYVVNENEYYKELRNVL